jgi:hypothetical protein
MVTIEKYAFCSPGLVLIGNGPGVLESRASRSFEVINEGDVCKLADLSIKSKYLLSLDEESSSRDTR